MAGWRMTSGKGQQTVTLDPMLLEILVCPETKAPLIYFADRDRLFCPESRLLYEVRDGIPVMLPDEAERVDEATAQHLLEEARELELDNVPD